MKWDMELVWQGQQSNPCARGLWFALPLVLDQKPVWTRMLTNYHFNCLQFKPNHTAQHWSPKTTGKAEDGGCTFQSLRACFLWQARGQGVSSQARQELTEAAITMENTECKNLVRGIELLMEAIFVALLKGAVALQLSQPLTEGKAKQRASHPSFRTGSSGLVQLQQPFPESSAQQGWLSCHTTWKQGRAWQLLLLVPCPPHAFKKGIKDCEDSPADTRVDLAMSDSTYLQQWRNKEVNIKILKTRVTVKHKKGKLHI